MGGQQVCRVVSPRQQAEIYWQAQSAWYVTLICSQFWHIWICKTRVVSGYQGKGQLLVGVVNL